MRRILPSSTIARVFFPSKAQLVSYCSAATLPAGQPFFHSSRSVPFPLLSSMHDRYGQNTAVRCRSSIKSTMPFVHRTKHTTCPRHHLFLTHPHHGSSKSNTLPPLLHLPKTRLSNAPRRRSPSHPCRPEPRSLATPRSHRPRAHTRSAMYRGDRARWRVRLRCYGGAGGDGGSGCVPECSCWCSGCVARA